MEEGYGLQVADAGPASAQAFSGRPSGPPGTPRFPLDATFGLPPVSGGRNASVEEGKAKTWLVPSLLAPADPALERLVELLHADSGAGFEEFTEELLQSDRDPQEVARLLLEPAARSIGEAWSADAWDFSRVTFAASRLQRLFWHLAARRPPPARRASARLALLAPAPGEQHTFGLSVVEDALRRAGWEVDCCRFGEEAEMFRLAARNHYCFVGLSVSGEALLPAFASAVARLRARSRNPSITVVGGGSLFCERPDLALRAGADLVAGSAQSIGRLAEKIFAESLLQAPVAAE